MPGDADLFRALTAAADQFSAAFCAQVPLWLEQQVRAHDALPTPQLEQRLQSEVYEPLINLLHQDIDEQRQTPLALLRHAVAAVEQEMHVIIEVPGNFAEVDADLHERSLRWGAAKAMLHLSRHKGD